MPHLVVIEGHESQRRKLDELLRSLEKKGYALSGKTEAPQGGWPAVFAASRSRGLFDDKRVTVLESAEALGACPHTLDDFLEPEGADDVIVAVFGTDSKKTFLKDSAKKVVFVRSDASVPPWKRKDWLLGLASERGCRLEASAAALLAESIESLEEMRSELEKLALYAEGKSIDVDTVRRLSFDEGGSAFLRFLDGVCLAKRRDVLSSLKYLQSEPSPLPLVAGLYNRLRPALYMSCFGGRGETAARMFAAIGNPSDFVLRMARSALDNYGAESIKDFMLKLIRLSYVEKTSFAEGWIGFEVVLWRLLGKSADAKRSGRG